MKTYTSAQLASALTLAIETMKMVRRLRDEPDLLTKPVTLFGGKQEHVLADVDSMIAEYEEIRSSVLAEE